MGKYAVGRTGSWRGGALCVLAVLLQLLADARGSDTDVPPVPEAVRNATVMIRGENQQGSGALLKTDGRIGYVVTNAHIVCDDFGAKPSVTLIFYSGTAQDKEVAGFVVAVDRPRDLALIRIEMPELPKPIPTADPQDAAALTVVHALGFPLARGRPQVTSSRCLLAGVRTKSFESLQRAEFAVLRGKLFKGNSGGPVVDESGKLLGLCTMGDLENERVYAVLAPDIEVLFLRRMDAASITPLEGANGSVKLAVTVPLAGFGGSVTHCTLSIAPLALVNPATGTRIVDKGEGTFRWPLSSKQALAVRDQAATGEVSLTGDARTDAEFMFGVQVKQRGATERFAGYFRGTVEFTKRVSAPVAPVSQQSPSTTK